jgi:exopolyphosphatase / guanosine-5'-triphosphate,3'-diphosphate pyrophosphatase
MVAHTTANKETVLVGTTDIGGGALGNPLKASVIDLGYNSLKMVSYDVKADGSFRAYDQRGELTRLGEGLHQTGFLGREPIERTLKVLELFKEINRLAGVDTVLAVATSAVREAGNRVQFLREAEVQTGIRFRVLTGKEEALFSYVGAAKATRLPSVLFFDLGGGSLELTYARDFQVRKILSLPVGALRMTELYGKGDSKYSKKDYDRMRRRILELLPTRSELGLTRDTVLMGVGGTLRALARYDQWLKEYPLNKVHNYTLRRKSIMSIHKGLRKVKLERIADIDAFGKDRAESITAGSLVIGMTMNRLGFEEVVVSTHGLRDGVLSEYVRSPARYRQGEFNEPKANASLLSWLRARPTEMETIIHHLTSQRVISPDEAQVLDEALVSFMDLYLSTRPETLFYSIISQDSFLDHRDQLIMAIALVKAKAPKMANWFYDRYTSILKDEGRESIETLAALIQFAELVELTRSKARVKVEGDAIRLEVRSPLEDFPEELLNRAAKDLEDATGRSVKAVIRGAQGGHRAVLGKG